MASEEMCCRTLFVPGHSQMTYARRKPFIRSRYGRAWIERVLQAGADCRHVMRSTDRSRLFGGPVAGRHGLVSHRHLKRDAAFQLERLRHIARMRRALQGHLHGMTNAEGAYAAPSAICRSLAVLRLALHVRRKNLYGGEAVVDEEMRSVDEAGFIGCQKERRRRDLGRFA